MTTRTLQRVIPGQTRSDGAGVKLRRSLGASDGLRLDPFLLLDEFHSGQPEDYLPGFPPHPHRGFETVTYMLAGHMQHQDHLGNRGDLGPGDVQWMTAGRGIIHSEMPQQSEGRLWGFQLWLNLPAAGKMQPPGYRDIAGAEIPTLALAGGGRIKVIAGTVTVQGQTAAGPVGSRATRPLFLDIVLPAEQRLELPLAPDLNALVYPYQGEVSLGGGAAALPRHSAAVLSPGDAVDFRAGPAETRWLLLAGRPLHEPVVQHGPFVMNTRAEIEQALADYRGGRLTISDRAR